jgi:hypothetical protein
MIRKVTRFLSITIVLALLFTLFGCGTSGNTDKQQSSQPASSQTAAPSSGPAEKEKVTLTILMNLTEKLVGVQDDPVAKDIENKTGITLDITSTVGMDLDKQLGALTAANDLPDIVFAGRLPQQRQMLLDAQAIIPLDDLLKTNGTEIINKKAGQYVIDFSKKFYSKDGKLYFIPVRAGVDLQAGFPLTAPYIRWDLYKAIGSPEVMNMDDLLNVLKQMQDKFPKTPEGKKAYAISGCLGDADWNTFSLTAALAFTGYRSIDAPNINGIDTSNLSSLLPDAIDKNGQIWNVLKLFNKAKQMGILDPDAATMKYDQWVNKLKAGQVYYQPFGWLYNSTGDPEKIFLPVPFTGSSINAFTCDYAYSQGQFPYAVSKNCKYPDRAMDLFNYCWSYEGAYNLMNGIQGTNWSMTDGKAQLAEAHAQELKAGKGSSPYFQFAGPLVDERTNSPIYLFYSQDYFDKYVMDSVTKEYCQKYNVLSPVENFRKIANHTWDEAWTYGMTAYSGELKDINMKVQNYCSLNYAKVLITKNDKDFSDAQDKFIKDILDMGAQKLYDFSKADYEKYQVELAAITK